MHLECIFKVHRERQPGRVHIMNNHGASSSKVLRQQQQYEQHEQHEQTDGFEFDGRSGSVSDNDTSGDDQVPS